MWTIFLTGVVVATITRQDFVNVFELRAVLDSHSHRLACERMREVDLVRVQGIVDCNEKFTPDGGIHELVQAHAEFHHLIYATCGDPRIGAGGSGPLESVLPVSYHGPSQQENGATQLSET